MGENENEKNNKKRTVKSSQNRKELPGLMFSGRGGWEKSCGVRLQVHESSPTYKLTQQSRAGGEVGREVPPVGQVIAPNLPSHPSLPPTHPLPSLSPSGNVPPIVLPFTCETLTPPEALCTAHRYQTCLVTHHAHT